MKDCINMFKPVHKQNPNDIEKQNNYIEFDNMVEGPPTIIDNKQSQLNITRAMRCNRGWYHKCERLDKIIDSLLIITIHIFFISIFEPLFYLNYVVDLEYNFIMSKILDETSILYHQYMTYSPKNRYLIDTLIMKDKYKTLANLEIEKNKVVMIKALQKDALYIQGIIYSGCILGFIILMCLYKYTRKSKIMIGKLLIENIVMILFLFIYEYVFFNNFIMKYDTIDTAEINYYGLLNFINYTAIHKIS